MRRRALLSRRAALTLPLAMALGGSAVAAPARHPDHQLLALARRHAVHSSRMNRLYEAQCEADSRGDGALDDRLSTVLSNAAPYGHELELLVAEVPATTPVGLRAKARAALTRVQFMRDGSPHHDDALLWSLCRDVLGADMPAPQVTL